MSLAGPGPASFVVGIGRVRHPAAAPVTPAGETAGAMEARRDLTTGGPTLLLMKGHPGTGKSTLARELARRLRWPLVDKDDARDALSALPGAHAADLNALSYAVMWNGARTQLRAGLSVVVDCPLARRALFEAGRGLAGEWGASVAVVECEARDERVWREWLGERAASDPAACSHKPQSWVSARGGGCAAGGSPSAAVPRGGGGFALAPTAPAPPPPRP